MSKQKTWTAKAADLKSDWFVVDATDQVLGRLASGVAAILRGKHKPTFTPHLNTGDHVVVINAAKVKVTGSKLQTKEYTRYSGYPGGPRKRVLEMAALAPLRVTGTQRKFDISIKVIGGGTSGQAGAIAHGIARALTRFDPDFRAVLKKAGLLTRDARMKERKKYGLKRARKAPQYTKR